MDKVKEPSARLFYFQKTLEHGWSRSIMGMQIDKALLMKGIVAYLLEQEDEAISAFSQTPLAKKLFFKSKRGVLIRYYKAVLENDTAELKQLMEDGSTHSKRVQIASSLRLANEPSLPTPEVLGYYTLAGNLGSAQGSAGLARLRKEKTLYRKAADLGMLGLQTIFVPLGTI